jgi:hypothetical protein
MNRPTKSEELFKKYCADQSYPIEKIPEGVDKTPDFLVTTPHGQIIAEVKETCPNDEDIKIALLPLSRQIFAGSNDKHFRNPVTGNTFETSWAKF